MAERQARPSAARQRGDHDGACRLPETRRCRGRAAGASRALTPDRRVHRQADRRPSRIADFVEGSSRRCATFRRALRGDPPTYWRVSGELRVPDWLSRAKSERLGSVYGTEGQRFESSRARCRKGSRKPNPAPGFVSAGRRVGTGGNKTGASPGLASGCRPTGPPVVWSTVSDPVALSPRRQHDEQKRRPRASEPSVRAAMSCRSARGVGRNPTRGS
jgi:hypothetical protein